MDITNAIEGFEMIVNDDFVAKAEALTPKLIETVVTLTRLVNIVPKSADFTAEKAAPISALADMAIGRDDKVCLDFGDHRVGYVSFKLTPVGSPPDAPVYFNVKFAEILYMIVYDSSGYSGDISREWI